MTVASIKNSDELQDLYRELILDHSRNPRNFGKLPGATHFAEGINPLCGDKLRLFLLVDDEGRVANASFEGTGCAISVASASLLTESVIGMPRNDALALFKTVTERLTKDSSESTTTVDIGKIRALDGVREFPARIKCATLAWHALHSAMLDQAKPVSTE
ncbi:MAG: Fe-S cluster assembly sulfur transfer protein SufU [Woeseiaceae bacterium]